jgi:uncharacterized protein (TIGR03437 family)
MSHLKRDIRGAGRKLWFGAVTIVVSLYAQTGPSPHPAASLRSQTIAFDPVPNQIFGISPFPIAAEASSFLPVTFTSVTPGVCKTASVLVMLVAPGTCSITASQGGNTEYSAATSVTRSFAVNQAQPAETLTASAASPFTAGDDPVSMAAGDFNGDGLPDLAVANFNDNTVTVLIGDGSGGFTASMGSPFMVGSEPVSIVVGDFNGDGNRDLATANVSDNTVTVLLGNGLGGFTASPGGPLPVGSEPYSVVVGDFNGDGIQDLATANFVDNTVSVLLGNGSGGFAAASGSPFSVASATDEFPFSLAAADFNRDGKEDLATANFFGGTVSVLLGNGAGGFTIGPGSPFAVGGEPFSVVSGDFNGDGIPDLATANSSGNNITVLLGNGAGGFTTPGGAFPAGSSPYSVTVGDFNGDGIPDLATANSGGNNLTVLLGNGAGGFTAAPGGPFPTAGGGAPYAAVVGDFNGDGVEDLATANSGSNNVTVLLGGSGAAGRTSQTIAFATLPGNLTLGSGSIALFATASSGLTVTFASSTPSVCTVNGNQVALLFAGNCTITASQAGNATYAAATPVTQSFVVNPPLGTPNMIVISTSVLPGGTVGRPYGPVTLVATGGSGRYTWSAVQLPAGLTLTAGGVLSGTPSVSGSFTVLVDIADNASHVSVTALVLTVFQPLSVTAASLPNGIVKQPYGPVTLSATGGSGVYSWSAAGAPTGLTISAAGVLKGTPTAAGPFSLTATVTDTAASVSASNTFSITILPSLSITTSALPNGTAGMTYGPATMAAAGGSGKYAWSVSGAPPGLSMSAAGVLSGTPTAAGPFSVTATVTDTTTNFTASQTYAVAIAFAPLTLGGPANAGGFAPGMGISAAYTATGGKSPYAWSAHGLPGGLALNVSTGALTGAIAQPGNYSFEIEVTDSQPVSASIGVSLFVLGVGITSLPSGTVNVAYTQTLSATGGSPPYTWSVTGGALPTGLSLATSGVLTGTPTAAGTLPPAGLTSTFSVSVTSGGVTVSQALSLTVTPQILPLSIPGGNGTTPVLVTGGNVAIPYSQTLPAVNGQPPYTWSAIGGSLPSGLSLNSSGTLSGTPNQAGTFAFSARASDTSGAFTASAFSVTIAPPPLTITTPSPFPNGIAGFGYPAQIVTASGGIPPYIFQIAGALPGGLTFSNGLIGGTPASSGISTFTVTATDSTQPVPLTATASFQISIEAAHTDLILSQTALAFSLNSGAAALPAGAGITVESSAVQQPLNYSVGVTPAAPWLDVTGGGATPGAIAVSLDPKALSLGTGVWQTSIVVTCIAPSPCAGNSQSIGIALHVATPPAQLTISTNLLSFSAQTSNPQPVSQTLGVENTGGGVLTVNSITAADNFVTIAGIPSTVPAGIASPVTVTVNPASLAAGYYQSAILIDTSAGSVNVPVTLLFAPNATMTLNPAGTQFQMPAGASPGNPNGSFLVSVAGASAVNWTATLLPGAGWLTLNTASGSSTSASLGAVNFAVNANAAALTAQAYYATIQITSGDAIDSPQNFLVVLNVTPAADPALPNPEPAGLVFIANGTGAPPREVQVFASAPATVNYQAASDSPWLLVNPAVGSTSTASPDSSTVSVNLNSLAAGVYRGNVSYAFSSAAVRSVSVTLLVEATAGASSDRPRVACAPSQLVPTQTGLVNNFAQPTSWPSPLVVTLVDSCGNPVTSGQIVTTFSNGDPPLALNATDTESGIYAGTWTPRGASGQVTVAARATAPGFQAATVQIVGQVTPNAAPALTRNGTLNVFAPVLGATLAPGAIVQIYGSNLAAQATTASTVPLPNILNRTSVFIGDLPAPLYYVSPGQINAQVPFELAAGKTYPVYVSANGALSGANSIQLTTDAPGIAQFPAGQVIATHTDGITPITETAPAAPGEYIVIYVAGMGLTNQTVPSGTASPSTNLALPLDRPALTLNGAPAANILFAGLTPTLVGLYQMNFQVPSNAPDGDLQLVLTQKEGPSTTAVLPVHQ